MGTHKNRLMEALLKGTNNICFRGEIRQLLIRYISNLDLWQLFISSLLQHRKTAEV